MNNFYVYIYLNQLKPGVWRYKEHTFNYEPFYIGKGRNKRETIHLTPSMLSKHNYKSSVIKSIIKKTGEHPIHYRIYENLSNDDSIKIEIDLIKHFGRRDLGTGILCNGTNGGEGCNNLSEESKQKVGGSKKMVHQYSLEGFFIKTWESINEIDVKCKSLGNLSTSIKRNGTFCGFIWSYNKVSKLEPRVKYQMPIKYSNIKQIDMKTGEVIKIFDCVLDIEKELHLRKNGRTKIYECLQKKIKSAYGYKWEI